MVNCLNSRRENSMGYSCPQFCLHPALSSMVCRPGWLLYLCISGTNQWFPNQSAWVVLVGSAKVYYTDWKACANVKPAAAITSLSSVPDVACLWLQVSLRSSKSRPSHLSAFIDLNASRYVYHWVCPIAWPLRTVLFLFIRLLSRDCNPVYRQPRMAVCRTIGQ